MNGAVQMTCLYLSSVVLAFAGAQATTLQFETTPPCQITIDGKAYGVSPTKEISVVPGKHRIGYRNKEMGQQFEFDLTVGKGKSMSCTFQFDRAQHSCREQGGAPKTSDGGQIDIFAATGAEVFMDGRLIGKTPLEKVPVSSGTHTIEIRHPDFAPLTQEVEVKAGETVRVDAELKAPDLKPTDSETKDPEKNE